MRLKQALIYARTTPWLRPLGRAALGVPFVGRALRRRQLSILPPGERVWVQVKQGLAKDLWMKVEPYRESSYLRGDAEKQVQLMLSKLLKPGDCFFDVGAHIGFYSLIAARLIGGGGQVIAFEPDPHNATILRENVARNGFSNIEVVSAAVWKCDGVLHFQRGGDFCGGKSSRRGAVIEANGRSDQGETISVSAITLDSYVVHCKPPSLIKIDVEGAESEVLKGAGRILAKTAPALICEVHHNRAAAFIEEFLTAKNYVVQWMASHPQFPFPRHVLALPADD
jgi:FkbM family methyltransferase